MTFLSAQRNLIHDLRSTNLLLLALVCCASTVSAQRTPTLKLDRHDLTILGLTIGSSTRSQVESSLGKMEVFKIGRGDEADEALCYRSKSRDDDTVLIFSFGALGNWDYLTQISISRARTLPWAASRCVPNRAISQHLQFLRGLKLGASTAEVLGVLGTPTRTTTNRMYYYVSHLCKSAVGGTQPTSDQCEIVDSVDAKFSQEGSLIYVSFYHFIDK